jgi:hypothetical protein
VRFRRGRDRMVVGFTTTYAIRAYHHYSCDRVGILLMVRFTRYKIYRNGQPVRDDDRMIFVPMNSA